jgi:uncharacterized membrane protein YsdA (DUF1294 family)
LRTTTVMFFSERAGRVRQVKIPRVFVTLLLLAALCGGGFGAWLIRDYVRIKTEVPEVSRLMNENRRQRVQLLALSQKIEQIDEKMRELRDFDHKLRVMVNMETGDEEGRFLGMGGSNAFASISDQVEEMSHRDLVRLMHQSLESLDGEVEVCAREKEDLFKYLENQKAMLRSTPSVWPTRGWVSSGFGKRVSPFTNQEEFHQGLDIATRKGTPILAPADGLVSEVGSNYGYGKILSLKHGYGLKTRYAHVDKVLVKKGEYVKRGHTIALAGNTGRTTGTHLHYEVHLNGVPVNPLRYILN